MKKVLLTLSLSIVASMGSFAQNEPYKNPKLTPEERAEDLLGRLTLKEKIGLMKNSSFAVERLGVEYEGTFGKYPLLLPRLCSLLLLLLLLPTITGLYSTNGSCE